MEEDEIAEKLGILPERIKKQLSLLLKLE